MNAMIRGGNLSRSVKEDISKQFTKLLDKYNYDAALQIIHILHFEFGFGEKRLQKALIASRKCKNIKKKDMNSKTKIPRGYAKFNSKGTVLTLKR